MRASTLLNDVLDLPAAWVRDAGVVDGELRVTVRLRRRRLRCPEHGVLAEGVPFARDRSQHTRNFEDLVAWLATKTDKTTISAFARMSWRATRARR